MSGASPAIQLKALAARAMIGTDRGGTTSKPEILLTQAAMLGTRARAGHKPRRISGRVPLCPPDPRPEAGAAPMATLIRLLGDPDPGLITEWCELALAKGARVADTTVPVLLDWWSRQPHRSEAVFAVLGTQGEWLASLNTAWRKPVAGTHIPADADEIWQTGTSSARVALLLTVRRHEPSRALALVQSTWQTDSADERRRFVDMLVEQCSIADEPFLESALDDKSKVVRRAAAAALSKLPASRLKARMNERAKGIIITEIKRGILKRGTKVSLSPPQDFDNAWERDGIEEQAPGGTGKRAWWLRQILSAADLSVWTDATGLDPAAVLEAITGDDYFSDALLAMAEAAEAMGNVEWCAAMLPHVLASKKPDPAKVSCLLRNLKPHEREPLILAAADHKRWPPGDRWTLLASAEYRWSPSLSTAALALLRKYAPRKSEVWTLYGPAEHISRLVAPDLAEQFAEIVSAMFPDEPTDSFKQSIDRVRLRADMHKEFAS